MDEKNGGPAFPYSVVNCCPSHGDMVEPNQNGMSLRDWFAGKAMGSYWPATATHEQNAAKCYAIADAMLAERRCK